MRQYFFALLVLAAPAMAQVVACNTTNTSDLPVCVNSTPTREFGQQTLFSFQNFASVSPNLVEGRELYAPSGIAFDASVTPPRVYIVDTGNNRVLAWNSADSVSKGNYADLVIGQPAGSLTSTLAFGPGTVQTTGLNAPTGIAVDSAGNLYVADSGNNRVMRFKTPFAQQAGNQPVDLVIGQKTSNSGASGNRGAAPGNDTLWLSQPGQPLVPSGLAIDASGNLWVADSENNRVLRFPTGQLTQNLQLPEADVALGQTSFTSNTTPSAGSSSCPFNAQCNMAGLYLPSGIAVDKQGNVYVADQVARVLQFKNPSLGTPASLVLGVPPNLAQGQTRFTYPTATTLGSVSSSGTSLANSPEGVFVSPDGTQVFVCDSPQNRVVQYDTTNQGTWTVPQGSFSPTQNDTIGQPNAVSGQANQGQTSPSASSLYSPAAGAIRPDNGEMWVVDAGNNRVVSFPSQSGQFLSANRVVGQTDYIYGGVNLIEGKELWLYGSIGSGVTGGGGVVVDVNSTPPHLYVADTFNNRILAFRDARSVGVDAHSLLQQKADLVIGQADLLHSLVNAPNNTAGSPTATGLSLPTGLAIDKNGNLWVADSGNSRVVRFPAPFAQTASGMESADVVLGQNDFTSYTPAVSQFNMVQPYGLAVLSGGGLAVSEPAANRILIFNPNGGAYTSGEGASLVVGQNGFNTATSGNSSSQLNSPRGIAVDSSDRIYVCDFGNNRVNVFNKPTQNFPAGTVQLSNLYQPVGIVVSGNTGRSWVTTRNPFVTDSNYTTVYQFPEFNRLTTETYLQAIEASGPLGVTLDQNDNPIMTDSANRLTFYYSALYYRNTASYAAGIGLSSNPAPNSLVELLLYNGTFNFTPTYTDTPYNLSPPWPTTENNIQVTVNGLPAPIFRIDKPSVNNGDVLIQIPNNAPSSGTADFVITDATTGLIYAAGTFTMQASSPGLYTYDASGHGLIAATVLDSMGNGVGTYPYVNSATNPVAIKGGILVLWLTGVGHIDGLPTDGTAPGQVFTAPTPTVLVNGFNANVLASVMSPQFPGLWQVNITLPTGTLPTSATSTTNIYVQLGGFFSNIGGTNNGASTITPGPDQQLTVANGLITTIYAK